MSLIEKLERIRTDAQVGLGDVLVRAGERMGAGIYRCHPLTFYYQEGVGRVLTETGTSNRVLGVPLYYRNEDYANAWPTEAEIKAGRNS